MVRWRFACAVIRPKLALVAVVFGAANVGWFSTLKNSKRNWKYAFSVTLTFFNNDGSHSFSPSWRTLGNVVENVRIWYAKVLAELVAKSAVLKAAELALRAFTSSAPGPP